MNYLLYSNNLHLASSIQRYLNYVKNRPTSIGTIGISNSVEINLDSKQSNIISDNHLGLFPSFNNYKLTNGKVIPQSNVQNLFNVNKFNIRSELDEIAKIEGLVENFQSILIKVFDANSYDLIWNNFEMKHFRYQEQSKKNKLYLFNILLGSPNSWEELTEKYFSSDDLVNSYFIFYWISSEAKIESGLFLKNYLETHDLFFGKTRFFRDYLISNGFAIEIDLRKDKEQLNEILIRFHRKITKKLLNQNLEKQIQVKFDKKHFETLYNNIEKSLEKIYGEENSQILLSSKDYNKFVHLSKLYIYNKNIFADNFEDIQIKLFGKQITDTINTHGNLKQKDKEIFENTRGDLEHLGALDFWHLFRKDISALLRAFINYNKQNLQIVFIDDSSLEKDEIFRKKISILKIWFPESSFWCLKESEWRKFFNPNENNLFDIGLNFDKLSLSDSKQEIRNKKLKEIKPHFVIIDLEFEGQILGFELLQKLRREIKGGNQLSPYIIALSRLDDPFIVRKAINYGALFYITKANFLRTIFKVFSLRKIHQRVKPLLPKIDFENWHLLNKLEPSKIAELKFYRIKGKEEFNYNKENDSMEWDNLYEYTDDFVWIKKLPKADIHCHIGSCMDAELLPKTALLVISEKLFKDKIAANSLEQIIEFLKPIVQDPYLNEASRCIIDEDQDNSLTYKLELGGSNIKTDLSIFEIITSKYLLKESRIIPEVALLDPKDTTLERSDFYNTESTYHKAKIKLRNDKGVSYDDVILMFILLIHIRETSECDPINELFNKVNNFFEENKSFYSDEVSNIFKHEKVKKFVTFLDDLKFSDKLSTPKENQSIISFLQSAFSEFRCLKKENRGLFNYLRGCEYAGAAHLQTKAAIFITCNSIVKYALADNIRYLELRCAVNGYSAFRLQTNEEAIETLLKGLEYFSKREETRTKKKCYVNLIFTAKRHKSVSQFDENVSLALKYRYGLKLADFGEYDLSKPTVVSFDLAGIEKGNRPSKFYQNFLPLLRECFPITIHAGEEDDYESIWEAVYQVQSQRLGHALTLAQKKELLDIIRERQITVELCPISNFLTNKNYEFGKTNDINKIYPIRKYFDENLNVTVNTDNPCVSNSNLTKEIIFAARLSNGGFAKWEILRLIKNAFKSASIHKKLKRQLISEVEEELFDILSNE